MNDQYLETIHDTSRVPSCRKSLYESCILRECSRKL